MGVQGEIIIFGGPQRIFHNSSSPR